MKKKKKNNKKKKKRNNKWKNSNKILYNKFHKPTQGI
jgi:hypothetical protein